MPDHIVALDGVTKTYQQGKVTVTAVDCLTLAFAPGEFTVISGPSGSGKTTTLNMIGALDVPNSGTVKIEGTDLATLNRSALSDLRRDRIGFVFQAYNLISTLTAFENAELVLSLQGVAANDRKEKVMGILERVGLAELAGRRPDELSGGQQQRVAIARAIAHDPAVVLADEPTANVDSATADSLLDLMGELNQERGITFLFSTHDKRVMDRGRRIVTMRDGRLESDERQ